MVIVLQLVAHYGPMPVRDCQTMGPAISRGSATGRAMIDRQTIHVHDLAAESKASFQMLGVCQQVTGTRTVLATPCCARVFRSERL